MPVLGPDFQQFGHESDVRQRLVEAKERSAVRFAHSLLESDSQPTAVEQVKRYIGTLLNRHAVPAELHQTPLAFYEPDDERAAAGEVSMAAYFSNIGGGLLYTASIRPGTEPVEERLGPLRPRAIISQYGHEGYPVVALDETGQEIFPSAMSIDERETFIDQVTETLSIIGARVEAEPRALVHIRGCIIP